MGNWHDFSSNWHDYRRHWHDSSGSNTWKLYSLPRKMPYYLYLQDFLASSQDYFGNLQDYPENSQDSYRSHTFRQDGTSVIPPFLCMAMLKVDVDITI